MKYSEIINRVVTELGVEEITPAMKNTIVLDVYDVMLKMFQIAEPIKAEKEYTGITTADSSKDLESDFYAALEVVFLNADSNRFFAKELLYEEYLRWNPNVTLTTTSFNDLVTDATPRTTIWTMENFDNDGWIGYNIPDALSVGVRRYIQWKPGFDGSFKVYYIVEPPAISDLTKTPGFTQVFHTVLVSGATMKGLRRMFKAAKTDVELIGLQTMYREFKQEFKEGAADFAGFINKTVSTMRVEPFDYLNDMEMLIL